jgi:tetratricopeptide (TPR) repeat protein
MPGRDVFISYSSKGDPIARLARERLEQAGDNCWFAPRDIPTGEFFAGQIIQTLRESRFVLLFFSEHSNASVQVVREINFAVKQRFPIFVVRLGQTDLSNDFECASAQPTAPQVPFKEPMPTRKPTPPRLAVILLAALALLILFALDSFASHQSHPQPQPTQTPTPEPTASSVSAGTISPTPPTASNEKQASVACERAYAAYDKGNYQLAVDGYSEAIRLKPDYPEAFYNRGIAYDDLQEYEKAIADYSEAIRLKPVCHRRSENRINPTL